MQETNTTAGSYTFAVAYVNETVDEDQRIKVLSNWLIEAFEREQKEKANVVPPCAY